RGCSRGVRVLLLPVGDGTWCVPLPAVREVLLAPRTTPLPTSREAVVGLFNLRGSVLPLFDTARLLGLPSRAAVHAAVLQVGAGSAALTTSGTPRAADLSRVVGSPEHPAALGTYGVVGGDDVAVLLDLDRLFA
ncbi:MAG: hypothetical protein JWO60_1129, partial [Frankiales bacterium]|nr:hypothetical protein [Frankiales bacterium]